MALPNMIPSAFAQRKQLLWKLLVIVPFCLIALHLVFFPESRQSIVRWGQSAVVSSPESIHDAKPTTTASMIPQRPSDAIIVSEASVVNSKTTSAPIPTTTPGLPVIGDTEEYVALCMAIKDQGPDLVEFFIHHYHHVGIKRFYIMDDASDPPLSEFEYPGVPRSALTFVYHDAANRTKHKSQASNYMQCIKDYGSLHTWMGFLDGDEFIEMTSSETLQDMLQGFIQQNNTIGQVVMNWKMHTSSGLLARPESARKSFVQCVSDETTEKGLVSTNEHVKPIVRTALATIPRSVHMWFLKKGYHTVGEHGDLVNSLGMRNPITRDRIALHHYGIKSREEYEEKMLRGNGEDVPKGEAHWNLIEKIYPHVSCPEMAKYYP